MADSSFHQTSVKRYGNKVSYSGGRNMAEHEVKKQKREPTVHKSRERMVVVQASEGKRLSRVESLLEREAQRKAMKSVKHKRKSDKSLSVFGQGRTGGKQKTKGTSKPPMGHAPTSQAHIEVFYSGSKTKFDVPKAEPDLLNGINFKSKHE